MSNNNQHLKEVNLCSINISGLGTRSKFMLNRYNDIQNFDILAIQETGASNRDKLHLDNMTVIADTNNSMNKGSALYVRNVHSLTQLKSISNLSKNIDSTWGLAVIDNKRYIIGSIYVKLDYPQAIQEVMNMLNSAHQMINKMKAAGVLLVGDYNARHISWGDTRNNPYGEELVNKIDNNLFTICTAKSPTFLCANGSSVIDLMIISNNLSDLISSSNTDEDVELFSGAPMRGHLPLIVNFTNKRENLKTEVKEKLCIDQINWYEWTKQIEDEIEENEQNLATEADPKKIWNYLDKVITKSTEKHGEIKLSSKHSKPYWTKHLTTLSQNLRKSRRSYKQRNTDSNLNNFRAAKEAFDDERKRECEDFLLKRTSNLNSVQAMKFWKEFKKIFKKKTDSKIDPLEDKDGGLITDHQELEDVLFSTFFEGHHLKNEDFDDEFYHTVNRIYSDIMAENTEENSNTSFEDPDLQELNREITISEIMECIKITKSSGKSTDNENFHPIMFKHLGNRAIKLLYKLFNLCLKNSEWVWDSAEVIFLKKAGKDTYAKPGSYRPISISAYIGKLLEKIIAARIQAYLYSKNLHDPDQEGFSKGKNTVRYLNRLHLEITTDKENKKTILCLFIDLEKAFDSIWKKGIIVKLSQLGLAGNVIKLIDKFLTSRQVSLNINGVTGNPRACLEFGLPQGSVLSPILFRIYLMDLIKDLAEKEGITLLKFADDGTIKISTNSTEECLTKTGIVLNDIYSWVRKWRLKINCQVNKTEVICFGTAENDKSKIPKTFKIGNDEIYLVNKTKVLGVIIDEQLSYKFHSDEVYKSLNAMWAEICSHSGRHWGFNQRTMVQLIKTLFIPKLMYAGHVWITKQNIQDIKSLWYKVLKATIGATFNVSAATAEVILGLPPIEIQIQINRIKHLLKLNISQIEEDRLKEFISSSYNQGNKTPISIHLQLKELFRFLNWKLQQQPSKFNEKDLDIITNLQYDKYFELSVRACSYNQELMKKYTVTIWKTILTNQFQAEGLVQSPNPSCSAIPLPVGTPRDVEVQLLSLMYKNNLTNNFLYSIGKAPTPLCPNCEREEHTIDHILLRCTTVKEELRKAVSEHLNLRLPVDNIAILNASRNEEFIKCAIAIVKEANIMKDIDLNITYT